MLTQHLFRKPIITGTIIVLALFIVAMVAWNTSHVTAATPVMLPIEVVSPDGTAHEKAVTIDVPNGASASQLWLQAHGLSYQEKASVKINDGDWIALRNDTPGLEVAAPARYFGGIGGGHQTMKLILDVSSGSIKSDTNTIAFRFNQTDGRASAFRILQFNFLDGNEKNLFQNRHSLRKIPILGNHHSLVPRILLKERSYGKRPRWSSRRDSQLSRLVVQVAIPKMALI